MGQELGRTLLNFGKPVEVITDKSLEPCPCTAEQQTECNIPGQYCETQQCSDKDQRTIGTEDGKEKNHACSESVVLETDDCKIAQILQRGDNGKHTSTIKHVTNSDVMGFCNEQSLQKGICITNDPLNREVNGSRPNCKAVRSEFVNESIKNNGAIHLIKNNKSEDSTKNKVKRKRNLQSIVIQKNEPVRKCRKKQEWHNREEGWEKHKRWMSRCNSKSSDPRNDNRRYSQRQSIEHQRHTRKDIENIHYKTPSSCRQIQNPRHFDMYRIKSEEKLLCCSRSGSPELKTANARSVHANDAKREWQRRDRDKEQRTEIKFDRYKPYDRIKYSHRKQLPEYYYDLNLDEVNRKHSLQEGSFSRSDFESSKVGRELRRKKRIKSVSSEHNTHGYENRDQDWFVRRRSTSESSCITVESSESYELQHCLKINSQRKRNLKVDRIPSNRRKAEQPCYILDAKVKKNTRRQEMPKFNLALQSKSIDSKHLSEIKISPQLVCKNKEEIQQKFKKHMKDIFCQKDKMDQAAVVGHVSNDSSDSAMPGKDAPRDLHDKLEAAGKNKGISDVSVLHEHSKESKRNFARKYISSHPMQSDSTYHSIAAEMIENGLYGYPEIPSKVQNPVETVDHSNISCFSDRITVGSNFKAGSVESNSRLNAVTSKPANLSTAVKKFPVLGAMPSVPPKPPAPLPILSRCSSSAFSSESLKHLVEKLCIQVGSGSFGVEKQNTMLVDQKIHEVQCPKKQTSSTSFEDTNVTNSINGTSNQRPSMLDLQIHLLNLSRVLSLALPSAASLASNIPWNLQLLGASNTLIPPQTHQSSGISTQCKPLSDWDWDAPSPYSDELASFSPPLSQENDSCKEVNEVWPKQKKHSKDFGLQISMKKNSTRKKLDSSNRLTKTVEAVKEVVLPLYSKRTITKDEYKQVMRVIVPKIFHCKTDFSSESIDRDVQACVSDVLAARRNQDRAIDL